MTWSPGKQTRAFRASTRGEDFIVLSAPCARPTCAHSVMSRLPFFPFPAKNEVRRPLGLRRRMDDQFCVVLHPFEPFGDVGRRIVNRPLGNLGVCAHPKTATTPHHH